MDISKFGEVIVSEDELCNLYMVNPDRGQFSAFVDKAVSFDRDLELTNIPDLSVYTDNALSIEVFDKINQSNWHMPDEYKQLDIAKWVLDQCITDVERQRVGEELMMYLERDLFPLLQYLKYLVDTMRQHQIVWGVGRGSSVSSYVLFLIGVHKIDSIFYDLDVTEFLR